MPFESPVWEQLLEDLGGLAAFDERGLSAAVAAAARAVPALLETGNLKTLSQGASARLSASVGGAS